MKHTHTQRLETWLGVDAVAQLSENMRRFYAPVAVHGVPGAVWAMPGGDFCGEIRGGQEVSAVDRAVMTVNREARARRANLSLHRIANSQTLRARLDRRQHAFASLSALIAAATGGKSQQPLFSKTGRVVSVAAAAADLWTAAGAPGAGAAGAAAPGGTASTSATTGAMFFTNPSTANGAHFVTGWPTATLAGSGLLLYDRLFSVAKTMNSTAAETVSGTFARYQNLTATAEDFVGGNFLFPSNPTTVLPATAHAWTICQYTNQANATANAPSIAGLSACSIGGVDLAVGNWFMPLATGDVGVRALTRMQASALVATGTIDFVVGHPIAMMPCPIANLMCVVDGINTAFNLTRIYDNACLGLLEMPKPAVTAATYAGQIQFVAE